MPPVRAAFIQSLDMAQRYLDRDHDAQMAAYVLRDLPETQEIGMDGLMWAAYKHGCVKNDVQPVLDDLRLYADGWRFYRYCRDGKFEEDLDAIQQLLGSILYEWQMVRDKYYYIRRV